jgi:hypothetical protein
MFVVIDDHPQTEEVPIERKDPVEISDSDRYMRDRPDALHTQLTCLSSFP